MALYLITALAAYSTLSKFWREDANEQLGTLTRRLPSLYCTVALFTALHSTRAKQPCEVGAMTDVYPEKPGAGPGSPSPQRRAGVFIVNCVWTCHTVWGGPRGQETAGLSRAAETVGKSLEAESTP